MPRQFRGRQKIRIERIEKKPDMYAAFSKRRARLYKNASDLNTLCGADIGVIVFSPTGKPHSFFSPSPDCVIERHMNPNMQRSNSAELIDCRARGQVQNYDKKLEKLCEEKEGEVARAKVLKDKDDPSRTKAWWEDIPVDQMNNEQVQELKKLCNSVRTQLTTHKEYLELVELKL